MKTNWRRLILLKAADILDLIEHPRLANELRAVEVPVLDGGGLYVLDDPEDEDGFVRIPLREHQFVDPEQQTIFWQLR